MSSKSSTKHSYGVLARARSARNKIHKKILVADDDPAILDITKIVLEDAGYFVQTSRNGQEIMNMKNDFPDLLLLDIRMAGFDGCKLCLKVKSGRRTKEIPVILFSANMDGKKMAKKPVQKTS